MRAFLVLATVLSVATTPLAAERLPSFKKHTPYPTVRAQLIRMGYAPVPVQPKPGAIPPCRAAPLMCRAYPEVVACTGAGALFCLMLFKRQADGRLLIVGTGGEPLDYKSPPDFTSVQYLAVRSPDPGDLADVVISTDARKGPAHPR